MTSSIDFALRPPDAGQLAQDTRVRAMSASERAEHAYRLRQKALVLVNQAADAAGPLSELDRAIFILRRLYPELSETQLAHIERALAAREAAGTWHGFVRPRMAEDRPILSEVSSAESEYQLGRAPAFNDVDALIDELKG